MRYKGWYFHVRERNVNIPGPSTVEVVAVWYKKELRPMLPEPVPGLGRMTMVRDVPFELVYVGQWYPVTRHMYKQTLKDALAWLKARIDEVGDLPHTIVVDDFTPLHRKD